jgi:hypothetical protein
MTVQMVDKICKEQTLIIFQRLGCKEIKRITGSPFYSSKSRNQKITIYCNVVEGNTIWEPTPDEKILERLIQDSKLHYKIIRLEINLNTDGSVLNSKEIITHDIA